IGGICSVVRVGGRSLLGGNARLFGFAGDAVGLFPRLALALLFYALLFLQECVKMALEALGKRIRLFLEVAPFVTDGAARLKVWSLLHLVQIGRPLGDTGDPLRQDADLVRLVLGFDLGFEKFVGKL